MMGFVGGLGFSGLALVFDSSSSLIWLGLISWFVLVVSLCYIVLLSRYF